MEVAGSDVKENRPDSRPIYSFGKTEVDWLVEMKKATKARIKEEKKPKSKVKSDEPKTIRVEEIEDLTTLSAGIDLKDIFSRGLKFCMSY